MYVCKNVYCNKPAEIQIHTSVIYIYIYILCRTVMINVDMKIHMSVHTHICAQGFSKIKQMR